MTNEKELDLDKLRGLLHDYNELELSSHEIHIHQQKIFQIHDTGWGSSYRNVFIHLRSQAGLKNSIGQNLLKYLAKNVVSNTKNSEIGSISLIINILDLLFDRLNRNEIERAVENQEIKEPYTLNEKQLRDVVESQVLLCVRQSLGKDRVRLVSTLCPIDMDGVNELILLQENGINAKIRKWDKTERAVFASQHDYHVHWDFDLKSPLEQETFLEIEYDFSQEEYSGAREKKLQFELFKLLNLIKWAVMVVSKNPYPLREGTCIITTDDTTNIDMQRRDANKCAFVKGNTANFVVKSGMSEKIRSLIIDFYNTSREFMDIWNVLWFFGRACLSNIERDILIESVIGLEKILVLNAGENTYRFSLHGATVFFIRWDEFKTMFEGGNDIFNHKEEIFKGFKDLYNERSGSVHGGNEETNEYAKFSLATLAVMIETIVYLHKKDLIDINRLNKNKKYISGAVEEYVVNKAIFGNSEK